MKKLKIAIDTGPLKSGHAVRGIGVNTNELINEIKKINEKQIAVEAVDFTRTDLSKYDLVHCQFLNPYILSLPLRKKTKTLLTIHDFIYLIYPKAYPPGIKGRLIFLLQKILIKKIDGIITISETSKKDIIRFLNVPENKVHVIYLAAKKVYRPIKSKQILNKIKNKYNLPDKFILNVGGVNYNKNLMILADACKKVDIDLVLVGKSTTGLGFDKTHPENKPFAKFLDKYGNDSRVHRLGFVPDEELSSIFSLATIYCQPSYYEGFSLGIVEAQSAGLPVIASRINVHKEIAGNSVEYFNPRDIDDLTAKINQLTKNNNLRSDLISKGIENAKKYSWQRMAKEILSVYKKILQNN